MPQDVPQERKVSYSGNAMRNGNSPLRSIAKDAVREMERNVILQALETSQWNRRKAAEALKISYRALIYKIRDAGLVSKRGVAGQRPSDGGNLARPSGDD